MKRLFIVTVLALIGLSLLNARSTAGNKPFRVEHPLGLKVGWMDGIGIDMGFGDVVAMDLTTALVIHGAKLRLYIPGVENSPYIGIGGGVTSMVGGSNDGGSVQYWLVHCGQEFVSDHVYVQLSLQYPLDTRVRHQLHFMGGLMFGYRF